MKPLFVFEGIDSLSEDQQHGLWLMLQGAIDVMVKYNDDPERGDVGWRKQTLEEQLIHANDHISDAEFACVDNSEGTCECRFDDDGLPHVDHATARIALYYAKKRLIDATRNRAPHR